MKILLVDDEQQVLKGVSRIIGCEQDEWEVETSLSGEEALEILAADSFDVVVSDMRMPGMDGAELLEEVGKRYPKILRVVLSGQADRESVLRAMKPMHQYLSKPCDPKKLIEVIQRAEIFQETISSSEVLDAIGRADCLPTFPEVVNEINREIESESGSSKTIAKIISEDPILSARILQLANSSIFSLRNPVAAVEQAVSVVGVDMIRSMAMSQAVFGDEQPNDSILSAKHLFSHGLQVATMAKSLAKLANESSETGNLVFSAGLLHDVGKLLLLNTFPEKYKAVLESSQSEDQNLHDLEMEAFGATHQGIGGYLLGLWGLPPEVVESVAAHHSFEACAHSENPERRLVFAANWIVTNRTRQELDALVENSIDPAVSKTFADQICQWDEALMEKVE